MSCVVPRICAQAPQLPAASGEATAEPRCYCGSQIKPIDGCERFLGALVVGSLEDRRALDAPHAVLRCMPDEAFEHFFYDATLPCNAIRPQMKAGGRGSEKSVVAEFVIGVDDDPAAAASFANQLPSACEFIDRHRTAGTDVLIHCMQGVSRSAAAAIAFLTWPWPSAAQPEAATGNKPPVAPAGQGRKPIYGSLTEAYLALLSARPIVCPNGGLVSVLCSACVGDANDARAFRAATARAIGESPSASSRSSGDGAQRPDDHRSFDDHRSIEKKGRIGVSTTGMSASAAAACQAAACQAAEVSVDWCPKPVTIGVEDYLDTLPCVDGDGADDDHIDGAFGAERKGGPSDGRAVLAAAAARLGRPQSAQEREETLITAYAAGLKDAPPPV